MENSIGGLVPSQAFFGEMLMRLCQALHFSETRVESHGLMIRVLNLVQVSSSSQLLLNHQSLFQQLNTKITIINSNSKILM